MNTCACCRMKMTSQEVASYRSVCERCYADSMAEAVKYAPTPHRLARIRPAHVSITERGSK